jgi:hypothetical protein
MNNPNIIHFDTRPDGKYPLTPEEETKHVVHMHMVDKLPVLFQIMLRHAKASPALYFIRITPNGNGYFGHRVLNHLPGIIVCSCVKDEYLTEVEVMDHWPEDSKESGPSIDLSE